MKWLNYFLAGKIVLGILVLLAIFHVFILFGAVPADSVWGGQMEDVSSVWIVESLALLLLVVFFLIVLIRLGYWNCPRWQGFARVGIWVMTFYFGVNLLGNLMSPLSLEKWIFTPITIILVLGCFRLTQRKNKAE